MDEVVDLIWSNEGYRERFTALIPADSEELFKAEFKKFFGEDNEAGEALRDTMGELAREFLSQIKINTITYNATLDVDDDLIDMLADNLDPEGTVDPVNTLDLYGEVRSSLPVSFEVAAIFPKRTWLSRLSWSNPTKRMTSLPCGFTRMISGVCSLSSN